MNYTILYGEIIKALNKDSPRQYGYNSEMAANIQLWSKMYENKSPWLSKTVASANLPVQIAYETAKLVTLELRSEIKGGEVAKYINEFYQRDVLKKLRKFTEYGLAKGSLIIKPIADKTGIRTQFIQADCFFPISFDGSGNLTKCVLADQIRKGRSIYTLLEIHTLNGTTYTIENRLFKSENDGLLGSETSLSEIEAFAELPANFKAVNVKKIPLGFFRCPMANQISSTSPLGVSVYSRAVDLIKEADRRYSNICWEYEATETAVHVAESMLDYDKENDRFNYPGGKDRLYRKVQYSTGAADKPLIDVFSPQIRSTELFDGWNNQLRMIEFACSLAYSTLSDPQNVDKTAEEIKSSKQRSYTFISDTQSALQTALEEWCDAAWFWTQIYNLVPNSSYKTDFDWGDSIISDPDEKRKQDMQDVSLGAMPIWEYRMKWYNEDEKTAKEMTYDSTAEVIE